MKHIQSAPAVALKDAIRPTTIIECDRLSERLSAKVTIASETFQHTGSFKFRAAYSLASQVQESKILCASSGNFGQALAYACKLLGKTCIVVMPNTAAQVKIDNVRNFGGIVDLTDVKVKSRSQRLSELASEHKDAYVASAYDNEYVIEGNATLGEEICALPRSFDYVVVPIGGGGLSSGIIRATARHRANIKVVAAEPLLANDAARSLKEGRIVANEKEPNTLADGAQVLSLGKLNWQILREGLDSVVEVSEAQIAEAVRLLYGLANLKVEPTGALAIGALLSAPDKFKGKTVCCVVSGGNIDAAVYSKLICPSQEIA
jgi:threonine dehydratase